MTDDLDKTADRIARTFRLLGETAYLAYVATVDQPGGATGPVPLWSDLTGRERAVWVQVAGAVFSRLQGEDVEVP